MILTLLGWVATLHLDTSSLKSSGIFFDSLAESTVPFFPEKRDIDEIATLFALLGRVAMPDAISISKVKLLVRTLTLNNLRMVDMSDCHEKQMSIEEVKGLYLDWLTSVICQSLERSANVCSKRGLNSPATKHQTLLDDLSNLDDDFVPHQQPGFETALQADQRTESLNKNAPCPVGHLEAQMRLNASFSNLSSESEGSRIARTMRNLLALVPKNTRNDDEVWFIPGGPMPFVLRPTGNGNHRYVGPAYIHVLMYGECFSTYGMKIEHAIDIVLA